MKAFLFKLSPGAFAGYGRVIAPLIAHSRAIAALAGVLGAVTKLYSQGLFSGIRLIMSLIMFDLCTARWQETAANLQQTRPCRRGPGWLRSPAVLPAGGYVSPPGCWAGYLWRQSPLLPAFGSLLAENTGHGPPSLNTFRCRWYRDHLTSLSVESRMEGSIIFSWKKN